MSLRVLVLTHVFPRSPDDAAAPFLLRYVTGLRAAGADVRVLAPHDAGLPEEHEVDGVPVRRVRYATDEAEDVAYRGQMHVRVFTGGGSVRVARLVGALSLALRQEVATWRPDVLDVHWLVPGGVVTRLARPAVPSRVVVHGTDLALATAGPVRRAAARWLLGAFDQVAAASTALAGELAALGHPAHAVAPMPYAPPTGVVPPRPAAGHVLAVGRLVPEKGHADLVRAIRTLAERGRTVRLTIVGDGPEADRIAALARSLGLPLELPGAVSPTELEAHYVDADVVAVPSHREGFGLVAAEALARHRPVVATATGGLTEIVQDGVTGWSVPPGDPDRLADAIDEVLDAPAEAERRAEAGAAHVATRWSASALGRDALRTLERLADG